jgi:hypothetical protein
MKRAFPSLALAVLGALGPAVAFAQTFPVVPGTLEIGAGMAAVALPEATTGSISAQPEVRVGYFFAEGMMLQVVADTRVWPLGIVAPTSYGIAGNVLWFPNLGPQNRNLYLMAGAGGALVDPPGPAKGSSVDPMIRGGLGVKVSLADVGLHFLRPFHLTVEFREEYVHSDENDFLAGLAFGLSAFR